MTAEGIIFILDIGTRSVIGIAGRAHEEMLEILCVESAEHSSRAVVDGQIEDIEKTAKIAAKVKEKIEEKLGVTLKEVHVAAAGRMLRTARVNHTMELDNQQPISKKDLLNLETAALQKAYEKLSEELNEGAIADFCSVGHSVVSYSLDGYSFSTLLGHKGKEAGIDLIATFLPNEVVESLYTTMSMLGLSVASMSLEPIAALNAVVPKELHLLNIALVDVGAGTSDIAVTDKGGICGYTMVTVAGDEITECIMRELLVDFGTAEKIKFAAAMEQRIINYEDVLGIPYAIELEELLQRIQISVEDLAKKISEGILSVNGTAPKAIFMVGGGSRTPNLCKLVAEALEIDEKRVAIGGSNYMKRQVQADEEYLNAEYATQIGIAITAMKNSSEGMSVTMNGAQMQLIGTSTTVMEALRRSGYQYSQIMGRSGKNIVYEYNGERRICRGGLHTLAEVQVNGSLAGLSTPLQAGDEIVFVPAVDGEDAKLCVKDAAGIWEKIEIDLFGNTVIAGSKAWVNDEEVSSEQKINQGDKVRVEQINTIGKLLEMMELPAKIEELSINGKVCTSLEQRINNGDVITPKDPILDTEESQENEDFETALPPINQRLRIYLNGKEKILEPKENGERYQFFHLLNFVNIDPNEPHGTLIQKINGETASYQEFIRDGDKIDICWSEEIGK